MIVAVTEQTPRVLTLRGSVPSLPSVELDDGDRTLELTLRRGIAAQAGLEVGYVEQLYTFGDLGRVPRREGRQMSIAYLALVREEQPSHGARWVGLYELFPWEDRRDGVMPDLDRLVDPAVEDWIAMAGEGEEREQRRLRAAVVLGRSGAPWDGVRVLERYELLYELGLLAESWRDGRHSIRAGAQGERPDAILPSLAMKIDHRRIVASAFGRLRGKLTYRPTVFELLPERFTLSQLQQLVEALAGVRLHKQNFRRLVESAGLVRGTGETVATAGRPAELFRFRAGVVAERPRPGVGTPWARG